MSFSLYDIVFSSGPLGFAVFCWLSIYLIVTCAISIERLISMGRSQRQSREFALKAAPLIEEWRLEELTRAADAHKHSALARLFGAIVRRYQRAVDEPEGKLSPVELARNEAVRRKEQVSNELRRGLGVLASIGSTAPFVGLLGTVLGIIDAFTGIATSGGGGLGAVSAGISKALFETAYGLVVAIPTVLVYNYFMGRANNVEVALERSASELLDELENQDGRSAVQRNEKKAA
jgi:biopolymer transport protein ExbB